MRSRTDRKPETTRPKPSSRRRPDYVRKLLPMLRSMEQERSTSMRKAKIASLIVWLSGAYVYVLILRIPEVPKHPISLLAFMGFVAIWTWLIAGIAQGAFMTDLRTRFKDKVIARMVKGFNSNLTYTKECTLTKERFNESMLYAWQAEMFHGEDMIAGTLGETRISVAEILAIAGKKDADGKLYPAPFLFKGLFYELDFNKRFKGQTFVFPDVEEAALGKVLGQWVQGARVSRGELIKLEDPEFERYFVAYGDDQIEARYILSPSLMRRIVAYRKKAGRSIRMSFRNGKVYVAIPASGNFMDLDLKENLLKSGGISKHLEDLEFALGIVEELNLNRRIWQT